MNLKKLQMLKFILFEFRKKIGGSYKINDWKIKLKIKWIR